MAYKLSRTPSESCGQIRQSAIGVLNDIVQQACNEEIRIGDAELHRHDLDHLEEMPRVRLPRRPRLSGMTRFGILPSFPKQAERRS